MNESSTKIDLGTHALRVREAGNGPTTFVCLHGFLEDPSVWSGVAAVLVAAHDGQGQLRLLGRVGSGFASKTRHELFALLSERRTSTPPIRDAVEDRFIQWVHPVFVAEVAFREHIAGQGLRHASWQGLRPSPAETVSWSFQD